MANQTPAATDYDKARDESVLAGLTPETGATPTRSRKGNGGATPAAAAKLAEIAAARNGKTENGKAPAVPARRTRKTTTVKAPASAPADTETTEAPATPARRTRKAPATAKAPAKPATRKAPAPAPAPAANVPTERQKNTALAVELLDLIAKHFGDRPEADQVKIANWVDCVPSGGAGWRRYWPAGFARPTTSGWVVPEGESL